MSNGKTVGDAINLFQRMTGQMPIEPKSELADPSGSALRALPRPLPIPPEPTAHPAMITKQQRDLRNAIVEQVKDNNDRTAVALVNVLGSVIEGVPIDRALGAPGDWGYDTPIGRALLAYKQSQP